MSRFMTLMVLAAMFFSPIGCASLQAPKPKPFAGLPFRHNGFDFKKAWKATPSPQGVVVQGVLKNIRYLRVEEVEITVSIQRKGDKIIAEDTTFLLGVIDKDEYRDFALVLKNASAYPGDLIHFLIKYRAIDGGSTYGWTSDFTADAVTGVPIRKEEEMSSDE
jgi:hypothetical protein